MKVEDLVLIAGVAGLVFIAAGFFSRRAQASTSSSVPANSMHPGLFSSPYWKSLSDPLYLERQAAAEAAWGQRNQPVDGWTVG